MKTKTMPTPMVNTSEKDQIANMERLTTRRFDFSVADVEASVRCLVVGEEDEEEAEVGTSFPIEIKVKLDTRKDTSEHRRFTFLLCLKFLCWKSPRI